MAKDTPKKFQNLVIYEIYVRNHGPNGTFNDVEAVRQIIKTDSLAFLSMEGLKEALGQRDFCAACFTKQYPTHLYEHIENANKDGKF